MTTALCFYRKLNIEQRAGAWRIPALPSHQRRLRRQPHPLGGSARLQGCGPGKAASVPVPRALPWEPWHRSQGDRDQAKPWATRSAGDPSPGSLKLLPEQSRAPFPTSSGRESPAGTSPCANQPCKGCRIGNLPSTWDPPPLCWTFCCACPQQGSCRRLSALARSGCTPGMEDTW